MSPVHARAVALEIPVATPTSLRKGDAQAEFARHAADVAVVAAYGLILPQAVLDAPRLGCLNIHASLLPRWRGAAPIHRAILAGDVETGVGIMQMEAGLDTGPVLAEARTAIDGKTGGELTAELAEIGAGSMVAVLGDLDAYPAVAQPPDGVTYAAKIDKAELRIAFDLPVDMVLRQIQAFNPPGAWLEVAGERIRILSARRSTGADGHTGVVLDDRLAIGCADGAIRPIQVQRAGRGIMTPEELLRGFPIPAGTRL